LLPFVVGVALAGCTPGSETTSADVVSEPVPCAELASFSAPGLEVVAAEEVLSPAAGDSNPLTGEPLPPLPPHCKVTGTIDDEIHFELHLPIGDAWNGRFAMGGGGGFVGTVQNQILHPGLGTVSALEAGYATAGTDTGHQGSSIDASWALANDTRERNFAERAVHVVTEVSKELTEHHYGRSIEYSYFMGCSRGGGQAMIASQRYPADYDGIVAAAPAFRWPALGAGFLQVQQAMYPDPEELAAPVVTAENRALLEREILGRCDALDGVEDGVLTDPRRCPFDPADLPRCASGPGPDCLTEAQLAAIQTIYRGPVVGGERIFPGFPFGGENDQGGWDLWITGGEGYDLEGHPSLHHAFGTEMYKYLVFDDPEFDYTTYDFANWHQETAAADELLSAKSTDLSAFRDRGGKMIFWHGWSDPALTALAMIDYYEALEQSNEGGEDSTRLYMLPGVIHCGGGPGADRVDWLGVIADWVERGEAPGRIVAAKLAADGTTSFTRPLCPYSQVAMYDGEGDPDDAASYRCE
jgi:feruloyl esterase